MRQTFAFLWEHPISRRRRSAALVRWLKWQLCVRLTKAPKVWNWIPPAKLVLERGMTGATGNLYCGLHEFADMALILHLLRHEDGFVDAGANVGSYTVLASAVRGARSLSIEPHPDTFAKLGRNIAVNGIGDRVFPRQVALGAEAGMARLTAGFDTMNRLTEETGEIATIAVEVFPLDVLLQDFPALVWKVDVEGFEEALLAGAENSLRNPQLKAILLETVSDTARARLLTNGFEAVSYDPFTRSFGPAELTRHNALWIRDRDFCEDRVRKAPRFEIYGVEF